jgi:hypothetical protein
MVSWSSEHGNFLSSTAQSLDIIKAGKTVDMNRCANVNPIIKLYKRSIMRCDRSVFICSATDTSGTLAARSLDEPSIRRSSLSGVASFFLKSFILIIMKVGFVVLIRTLDIPRESFRAVLSR